MTMALQVCHVTNVDKAVLFAVRRTKPGEYKCHCFLFSTPAEARDLSAFISKCANQVLAKVRSRATQIGCHVRVV